jgi:phosphopantetheinyl transferase
VDIEEIRPLRGARAIAARFFSSADVATLEAVAPADWERTFFHCWVRTEAYIKAVGETVWSRLENPGALEDAGSGRTSAGGESSTDWETRDLELGDRFVGALVFERKEPFRLRYLNWVSPVGRGADHRSS